ncbi:ribose 5-phosphate isomerase B [Dialister sp.]|uniref:ribose 5-phosphate isomerase B n=1 Tax=Dialister sp. TaxID=1955814 RepID=UPI002E8151C1|nr:ribose 5-phosphate isomerase B [Dialister sp.]MEE3451962.1 ribose 5-phosphate isomerase B [Dialister sp.]
MKIAIASDHGGFALKESLKKHLSEENVEYIDCGTDSEASCDYPDFAQKACRLVQDGKVTYAVLICGTGIGMCIAANKMKGIRAALCSDTFSAHFTRAHNDANVMTMGARVVGPGLAEFILDEFLKTPFEGGRHARRIGKIAEIEKAECHV